MAATSSSEDWKARAEAAEVASQEAESSLNDLFICLGQEERKVEALSERLQALGVDAQEILAGLPPQEAELDFT